MTTADRRTPIGDASAEQLRAQLAWLEAVEARRAYLAALHPAWCDGTHNQDGDCERALICRGEEVTLVNSRYLGDTEPDTEAHAYCTFDISDDLDFLHDGAECRAAAARLGALAAALLEAADLLDGA